MIIVYIIIFSFFIPSGITSSSLSDEELECIKQERAPIEHLHKRIHTSTAGHPAYLHCIIPNGTNHLVAWTRHKDSALLTAGTFTFSSDPRFQISKKSPIEWTLIIRTTNVLDSGCYLCEVNTLPSTIVYPIYLHVNEVTLSTSIIRSEEGKLMANVDGEEVVLNCTLSVDKESSGKRIIWMRNGEELDVNDTHKYIHKWKRSNDYVIDTLRIRYANNVNDSGHYSCAMDNGKQNASQIISLNMAKLKANSSIMNSSIILIYVFILLI